MNRITVTARYRATIPMSVGRVRSVDAEHSFAAYPTEGLSAIERQNTLRLLARQRVADLHRISPLLVFIRDITESSHHPETP